MDILFVIVSAIVGVTVGRFNVLCWVNRDRPWVLVSSFALVGPVALMGDLPIAPLAAFLIAAMGTVAVSISMPERRDARDESDAQSPV